MKANRRIATPTRSLGPGPALLLVATLALAVEACDNDDAVTAPPANTFTVAGMITTGASFDVTAAKTEARFGLTAAGAEAIRVELNAALDAVPARAGADFVATWEQAGGVAPEPFVVTIPAECFVADRTGFHVEDFRGCGVTVAFGRDRLALMDFDARLVSNAGGSARFDLGALMSGTPDDGAPVLLGALGGAVVMLAIGGESAGVLPLGVETVSGVDPTPF